MGFLTSEGFWKVVTPILTFIAGTIYSIFIGKRQSKHNVRAYPQTEELYFPLDLSDLKVKENTKLCLIGDYSELAREFGHTQNEIIYLKVTNFGPGHMINCNIRVQVSSIDGNNKSWDFNAHVPFISKDEYIIIPLMYKDMKDCVVIIKKIEIYYQTQSDEKMLFEQNSERVDGESTVINQNLFSVGTLSNTRILGFEGKDTMFNYLNSKNKQSSAK